MSAAQAPPAMTSRERVLAALRREPVDRTPLVNPTSVATVELMDLVDAPFPDANREPELMARLAATGHTELGFDSIMPVFSIIQESSALGCKIQWEQKDNWPTVKMREPIYETPDDIRIPDDLLEHPDTQCVLEAIKLLRKRVRRRGRDHRQDDGAVVARATTRSASSRSCSCRSTIRPRRSSCLERLKEVTIVFGMAQIEAGADALTLPDHATGDLVSGDYYRRYLRDMHNEFAEELAGADHPAHLRAHGGPHGLHRRDRHGGVPLRLQERARPSRWRRSTGASASSATSTIPRRCTPRARPRCATRSARTSTPASSMVGPECAIPLQTPIENLLRDPRCRRRVA